MPKIHQQRNKEAYSRDDDGNCPFLKSTFASVLRTMSGNGAENNYGPNFGKLASIRAFHANIPIPPSVLLISPLLRGREHEIVFQQDFPAFDLSKSCREPRYLKMLYTFPTSSLVRKLSGLEPASRQTAQSSMAPPMLTSQWLPASPEQSRRSQAPLSSRERSPAVEAFESAARTPWGWRFRS
jgi:hypothetical protein